MERYLRASLLGRGPRLMKKKLPGRGLTKVEEHWFISLCLRRTVRQTSKACFVLEGCLLVFM